MENEKIEVSENEIDEEIKKLKEVEPQHEKEVRGRITNSLRLSRLFDRFMEK